jgi:hypothetical protein
MNTSLLLGACVALFTTAVSLRADINPDNLSGRYRCEGDGYVAEVLIRKNGESYDVQWQFAKGVHAGVGIREGGIFASSYGNGADAGVVVYRIERDRLVGKYTAPGLTGAPPVETLTPLGALAAEAEPARGGAFTVGARVAARWAVTEFYLATVKSRNGEKYHVVYDDNAEADLTDADLVAVAKPNDILPGRRVLACWASAKMYPGTVLDTKGAQKVIVKWDDGSAPSDVATDKLALLPAGFPLGAPAAEVAPAPGGAFAVGARVAARWVATAFYIATVKSRDGDKYHVLYDDNDQADVTSRDLISIAKPEEIVPGRRVLACWMSPRMYPGTVLEANGADSVIVKWDDGSQPSPVAKSKIAILPAGVE